MRSRRWPQVLQATVFAAAMLALGEIASGNSAAQPHLASDFVRDLHHELSVTLHPAGHSLSVVDILHLPSSRQSFVFSLHEGLKPRLLSSGALLSFVAQRAVGEVKTEEYRVDLAPGTQDVTIAYGGEIFHPLHEPTSEAERGISETPGLISEEGIALFGETYWYPHVVGAEFFTFELTVTSPPGWEAMSQGVRTWHDASVTSSKWLSRDPGDEIHLHAARFYETDAKSGAVDIMVFLRQPDPALAQKYIGATDRYLRMYSSLLGEYPYGKFALVENFWDTGYGLPSFTLLGSNVLRLPFIVNSSYPHEILHDWWGNGVYVNETTGNWCEGLTSYLADHLLAEQVGNGVAYRRDSLDQFTSVVNEKNDFPLSKFTSRHDPASAAIGYGKSLMFFHMLRSKLGDGLFVAGLRRFYEERRFKAASFDDLRRAFEDVSPGVSLKDDFTQWVTGLGAPELSVRDAFSEKTGAGYRLHLKLDQMPSIDGSGRLFSLYIPLAVHLKGQSRAHQTFVTMTKESGSGQEFTLDLPVEPYRVDVDPEFDVFRRLSRDEVPPSFSRAFGAQRTMVVVPDGLRGEKEAAYRRLAETIQKNQSGTFEIKTDAEFKSLADLAGKGEMTIWVLGFENHLTHELGVELDEYGVKLDSSTVQINGQTLQKSEHGFAFVLASPSDRKQTVTWVAFESQTPLSVSPIFGAKLPHYGKYSFAAFEFSNGLVAEGGAPSPAPKVTHRLSGQWPTLHSPLSVFVRQPDGSHLNLPRAQLAPRVPLAK